MLLLWQATGLPPKPKAAEYPVHASLEKLAIGAEYLVRSFGPRGQTFIVNDYLVVEVALYPAAGQALLVSNGQFTLRMNGKKSVLFAQAPAFVAASLKYPDWERRPTLTGGAGIGDAVVILGQPQSVERFPGDPRPGQTRLPAPPRAPEAEDPSGIDKPPPARADEVVVETALPEGETRQPVAGFLYFAHKGKTKSIRSLELIYNGPAGTATLRLL